MIILFFIYLLVHLALYALVLRQRPVFHGELPIFLYHALPAAFVALLAVGAIAFEPSVDRLLQATLFLALQGIYSISFLELWSLAQGGYSIQILIQLESARRAGAPPDLAPLEQVGASKKRDRLRGLRNLALVRPKSGGGYGLTAAGRVVSGFLHAIRWLARVRESG